MNGTTLASEHPVSGPWSLATSRAFWEGFAPSALAASDSREALRTVFVCDSDWRRVEAVVRQSGSVARIEVTGDGDLDAATAQVLRFLSLDVDAQGWPEVGRRDPVIADAQRRLPGFRPCGFHSPYEAAVWAVLSQRLPMSRAASARAAIIERHGERGAPPAPAALRGLAFDLPGRKEEYLHAVADAALEGRLDGAALRELPAEDALARVRGITGLGPFGAELVVIRGACTVDVLPRHEKRLEAEIAALYPGDAGLDAIAEAWRPFRTWAAVHLRALGGHRSARRG